MNSKHLLIVWPVASIPRPQESITGAATVLAAQKNFVYLQIKIQGQWLAFVCFKKNTDLTDTEQNWPRKMLTTAPNSVRVSLPDNQITL